MKEFFAEVILELREQRKQFTELEDKRAKRCEEREEIRLRATCRGANASTLCLSQWGSIGAQYNEQLTLNLTEAEAHK